MRKQRLSVTLLVAVLVLSAAAAALAQDREGEETPGRGRPPLPLPLEHGLQPAPPVGPAAGAPHMGRGSVEVFVELAQPTLAQAWLASRRPDAAQGERSVQRHAQRLALRQASLSAAVEMRGGQVLAAYANVFNGLAVRIDAARLDELQAMPGVAGIEAVVDYHLALNDTIPWIGASAVQQNGFDGSGIRVAVVDTGIDYTHAHLGGSGSQADTDKAVAQASQAADPALFPSSKVVGGYDFVGSSWDGISNTKLDPDPNPMDDNGGLPDGHGTHVASIIGGLDRRAAGGVGPGVAPGVTFYALKACSSVSTACSAIAVRQALEWAADPDGDQDFTDRADVLNLSLGAPYGQTGDQDLAIMDQLSALGMISAAAAGNAGNAPYVVLSPARAESVIAVAQTSMPQNLGAGDSVVPSSSRGPAFDTQLVKPEIGAPGASFSASSGNQGYTPFSGTSGSTPMVAGATALLLQANGGPGSLDWMGAKALLMNYAVSDVEEGSAPAPASRIGAGRLRIDAAAGAQVYAYVVDNRQPALSFGLASIAEPYQTTREVRVVNNSAKRKSFSVTAELRDAANAGAGVTVQPSVPAISVPPGRSGSFDVLLKVDDPLTLPVYNSFLYGGWALNDGDALTAVEIDGMLTLTGSEESLHLPFHFVPRQAADLAPDENELSVPAAPQWANLQLANNSAVPGTLEAYTLFDINPPLASPPAADQQPVDLQYVGADVLVDPFDGDEDYDDHNLYAFAIATHETRSHPANARHLVYVDLDLDGQDDWIVYNVQRNDGVWVSAQYDVALATPSALFTLDTALNSNTMVLYMLLPQEADPDLVYDFRVVANDAYFLNGDGTVRKSDESPLGGGYHRHDFHNPAFITDLFFAELGAGESVQSRFQSKLSDSTQIGYLYRFPNGVQEMSAVTLSAAGFYGMRLPVVSAAN